MTIPPSSGPVAFRLRRPYSDADSFVAGDGAAISRSGMVLIGAAARPVGLIVRFEIALRDGSPLFRGEGRVVVHRTVADGEHAAGLEIRFTRLDSRGKSLVEQVVTARGEAHPSQPPPSLGPASFPPLSLRSASMRPPVSQPPPTLHSQPAAAPERLDAIPVIPPLLVPAIDVPAASTSDRDLPPPPGSPLPVSPGSSLDPPAPAADAAPAADEDAGPDTDRTGAFVAASVAGDDAAPIAVADAPVAAPGADATGADAPGADAPSADADAPGADATIAADDDREPAPGAGTPSPTSVGLADLLADGASAESREVTWTRDERLTRLRGRARKVVVPGDRDALLARLRGRRYGRRRRQPGGERGRRAR